MEIGGFFEFPEEVREIKNSALDYLKASYKNYCFFKDGRQSIKSVLLTNNDKLKDKVCYLPAYLCYSVFQPFKELGMKVIFYKHKYPLSPIIDEGIKNSLIFILDYFGTEACSGEIIRKLLKKNNIIILDITHSIFNKKRFWLKHPNLYLVSSLRKVFPIPDGGMLFYSNQNFKIKKNIPNGFEKMVEAMRLKNFYLKNKTREKKVGKIKNRFLKIYQDYEKEKNNLLIREQEIPAISLKILNRLDAEKIMKTRFANLQFLYKKIAKKNLFIFKLKDIKSPFVLPLVFKDRKKREEIKKLLIENSIYPPTHWEDLGKMVPRNYFFEHDLSKRILSLPIDQRYDEKILAKITNIINEKTHREN